MITEQRASADERQILDEIFGGANARPQDGKRASEILDEIFGARAPSAARAENPVPDTNAAAQTDNDPLPHWTSRSPKKQAFYDQTRAMFESDPTIVPQENRDSDPATWGIPVEPFDLRGRLNPPAAHSGVLLDAQREIEPGEDDVVLPSGSVLRKSDRDMDDFFRTHVASQIDAAQRRADARYEQRQAAQTRREPQTAGAMWRASLGRDPMTGFSPQATADVAQQMGTRIEERGPARIVADVLAGIDPQRVNAFISDHLADDAEFAAAAERLQQAIPPSDGISDQEVERLREGLSPAQCKEYDRAVEQEQRRIAEEQEAFQKAAGAAWTRQAALFRQQIVERLVEEMARRNMPQSELEAFARTAYNASIPGMLLNWAVGQSVRDRALHAQIMQRAMERYDPSILTRMGGEVAGLLLSGPLFSAGGALGKAGASGIRKLAERSVAKRLLGRGLTQGAEGVARRLVASDGAQWLAQAGMTSGATLGTYDLVATPLAAAAAGDTPSVADALGAAGRGFATGMLLPGIGRLAGRTAGRATTRLGRYAAELGGFAAENAAFVGMGTLYEGLRTGEWGSAEQLAGDFGHSVGVLGILKGVGTLKRGGKKNPDFYDKVIAETEFTPEEVEALNRAGVDGRSYKRAIFDLLRSENTPAGLEQAEHAAREIDRRYAEVMQSAEVPLSAKVKLMYLAGGRIPSRLPLTTDVRRTVGEDGRTTVDLLDPAGTLVQRRTFASARDADAFERQSAGVREINAIQYYEALIDRVQTLDAATEAYAAERGVPVEAVKDDVRKAVEGQPHDRELIRKVVELSGQSGAATVDVPGMLAAEIGRKHGLREGGFEQALSRREEVRTPQERAAVAEYAARLKEIATRELRPEPMPEQRAERQLVEAAEQAIVQAQNRDDGVLYTATMRDGRQANIIKGANLVYDPQTGEVDAAQSDPTVVVRYDDGTKRQVSIRDIDMIVEAVSAGDARSEAWRAIREQLDAAAREEALAEAVEAGGLVQLKDGRIGAVEGVNEDGSYQVALQDGEGRIVTEQVAAGDIVGPVEEDPMPEAAGQNGEAEDPLLGRSLTAEEAVEVIGQMEAAAVPAPELELTPENWVAQFGEEGKVQTPIGEVRMGENQLAKLFLKGRDRYFGMIKPTLTEPDMVLEKSAPDEKAERQSKYLFVKTFLKQDGSRFVYFESVTVSKNGMEVAISNHEADGQAIKKEMQNGKILHLSMKLSSGSDRYLTKTPSPEGPDLVPSSDNSIHKDTTSIPEKQTAEPEIPRLKNGQPDFNAMTADMLAVELSAAVGHDKAVERLRVARGVNAKNMEKLRKSLGGMGDLNKAIAVEKRLGEMQQEDARLAGALVQLGAVEAPVAGKAPAENFSQEIGRLFPEGLPNVRARVLADIARGQRFVWNDSPDGTKRGVATELGFTGNESERRARFGMLGSEATGAKHVSRYVHDLWQDSNGYAFDLDDAALRDVVIDVLLATPSRASAMEQLRGMAARAAEDAAAPRDAEDLAAMQEYEKQRKILSEPENNGNFAERAYSDTDETATSGIGDRGDIRVFEAGLAPSYRKHSDGSTRDRREAEFEGLVKSKEDGTGFIEDHDEPAIASGHDGRRLADDAARAVAGTGDRGDIRVFEKGLDASYNEHSGNSARDRREAESERLVNKEQENGKTKEFKRDNGRGLSNAPDTSDGMADDATGRVAGVSDRGDIRVFEAGLAPSYRKHTDGSARDRREAESQRLVAIAKEHGLYIDEKQLSQFGDKRSGKTGESVVYIDLQNGKAYKSKNPYAKAAIKGNMPEDAIFEHLIHNLLFPEAAYHFEGISEYLGDVRIVLSQEFVQTYGQPTKAQIETALAERGLYPEDKYTFGNDLVSVTDIEGDNVLLGADGQLYFIDPIIRLKKPAREVIDELSMVRREADGGSGPEIALDEAPFSVVGEAASVPAGVTPERWNVIVDHLRRVIGAEHVVTDPAAVWAAYDRIMGRGLEIRRQQVAEANERFNEQLDLFEDGTLPSDKKLVIGRPCPVLLASGVDGSELYITQSVLRNHLTKHGLSAGDLKNLPEALEHPIIVYEWGSKAKSIVIITSIPRGNERITVAVRLKTIKDGIKINKIASIYGKSAERLLADMNTPLTDFGAENMKWVDKEKVLDWMSMEAPLASSASDQGLITAVKIVTNFENPKIGPENLAARDGKTCFFHTPEGEVYGFTVGGVIYLDGSRMNAATPMHEYTELWSQIVARENPELWERGVELIKQTSVWDEVNADSNYKELSEALRASETLARIVADEFAGKQAAITDSAELLGKLRAWMRKFWGFLKGTFAKWTKRELNDLTTKKFVQMPLRDFVEGINLQKEVGEQITSTDKRLRMNGETVRTVRTRQKKSATEQTGAFDPANPDIRFNREFPRRRMTTLEKLGNRRAELIADRENIANFDEQLAAVEADMEAYMRSDPVAETFGEDGSDAGSDAHLLAVEDAVYDMQRAFGIENPVTVVRDRDGFIAHCRELGVPETKLRYYELINCPNGIRIGDAFIIRANDARRRVDAEKILLHEWAHFITRQTWMESDAGLGQLYDAAVEAGADYMNVRLERREKSYHVDAEDPESMIDGVNEMVSRNVDILWKKGILQKYASAEEIGIDGVDEYMSAHGVPEGLKKLVLFQCSTLKDGKFKVESEKGSGSDYSRLFPSVESYAATDVASRGVDEGRRKIAGDGIENGGEGIAGDGNGHLGGGRGRDINPSFTDNDENSAPKLTEQQQLISDLRRAVRESKASARAVAQIVGRRIRREVGTELVEVMGKREFDSLVRQIEEATARQEVEKPLQRIAEIVADLEIKRLQKVVDDFLKLKVQGEGPRGVSVAKEVDDRTRRMFEIFRNNLDRPAAEVAGELRGQEDADTLYDLDAVSALEAYQEAVRYGREVDEIDREVEALRARNTQLRRERIAANKAGHKELFELLKKQILYNNELIDALDAERVETKGHRAGALKETAGLLSGRIGAGREKLSEWKKQEEERRKKIVNEAFRDVDDGSRIPVLDKRPGVWTQGYRRTVEFLLSPAYSMDYLLKMMSVNAPKGEGALYDRFMRGTDGYVEARGRYYLGYENFKRVLDEKARAVFGKSYAEVVADSNAPTEATITITNAAPRKPERDGQKGADAGNPERAAVAEEYNPTIGEALYIYMANKMTDGRVKLKRMGITEEVVDTLAGILPARFIQFADWLQNEFLPERRKTYNATHLAVFGTQMARIENYVPLKIQKSYVRQEVDGSEPDPDTMPSAITGSIIRRTRNNQILNLHTNALDLMLEHGQQMEHWNAFTRVVLDMNALLTSTAFRRMLDTRNPGLHKRLKVAAQLAADTYRPQANDVNRAWIALGKLAASSKIAFRVNTALKQVLSYPAFYAYSPDPKFWALLTKNLAPTTWAKNFRWCTDNIPSFRERWLGRMAGNEKLAQMTAPALDKWLDKMNRYGMLPNAFVDALTCANGAKAVYDFRRTEYMERGKSADEAERLARIDAAVSINATQQSSEGMYIGQMQADRDFWSVSLSTFQNSNFAYLRKQLEGIDELFRDTMRERRNRTQYYKEQGFSEDEAFDRALKEVTEAKRGALLNIGVFMFGLNILWGLGNNIWKYLFAPETRDELPGELAKSAFVAAVRNTTVGSLAEGFASGYGANPSVLLSDMIAFTNRLRRIVEKENPDAWNETAAYLTLQTISANGLGIDLESFVNMYQGIAGMIRDGVDVEDLMRMLNAPQSQAKLLAGEPKEGETEKEYNERMIFTERRIAERVGKKRRDKWTRNYTAYRQAEALGMSAERDRGGNVFVPELKELDTHYSGALEQSGLTSSGKMRDDYAWQSLTEGQREQWRARARSVWKIYVLERELDRMILFDERYAARMRELMQLKREFIERVTNDKR